ncbi:MAG: lytic transglycosylase domain-containing protein [Alphaproteobacteria bacterium]|nr:lytic transglycosylase domain-containing protein [Alphaproteobacteria bacterium]
MTWTDRKVKAVPATIRIITLAAFLGAAGTGAAETLLDAAPVAGNGKPVRTASVTGELERLGRVTSLPDILSAEDLARYRAAILFQEKGAWAAADKELGRVSDPVLKGSLLADRYLSRKYQPKPAEIKDWMAKYADHPDASRIFKMAGKGQAAKGVRRPAETGYLHGFSEGSGIDEEVGSWRVSEKASSKPLNAKERAQEKAWSKSFRKQLKAGNVDEARRLLESQNARHYLDETTYDEARLALATGFFLRARDEEALDQAVKAAQRSGDDVPGAHWIAGLSAWRLGNIENARIHFEVLANRENAQPGLMAAAAFWAGRANLALKRPEMVDYWFTIAASQPRSFYGLLSHRMRGLPIRFEDSSVVFTEDDAEVLLNHAGSRRALALIQLDQQEEAEREFRKLYTGASPGLAKALLGASKLSGMPGLAIRLGGVMSERDGRMHDAALYPLPPWKPDGGWRIDRALVYALMRQESAFNPTAKSRAGAKGLMQLMPGTAKLVGGRQDAKLVMNPEMNIELAQRYIESLLRDPAIDGNLFLLAAAYNGGPGKAMRWERQADHRDDPLLLLESIPSRETRAFIKRVSSNLWMYRARLKQPNPELDLLAAGEWPAYAALDSRSTASSAR